MGDLILLNERRGLSARAACGRPAARRTAFFFDVSCPFSYLAAERVERLLGRLTWIPATAVALPQGQPVADHGWEALRTRRSSVQGAAAAAGVAGELPTERRSHCGPRLTRPRMEWWAGTRWP